MDKNGIKKFAVWARKELLERVRLRALHYGVSGSSCTDGDRDEVNGRLLTDEERAMRFELLAQVQAKGYEQVMEEAAYTWFNRFCAVRFMEVNGYLPGRVRVFTDEENRFRPQILTEAINLEWEGLDFEKIYALQEANEEEELFRYLFVAQCRELYAVLPEMFRKLDDYLLLLLPDNLLRQGSVLEQLVATIPEEDWQDAVQIIGWLYQYYNTEPKNDTFALLKKNVKITKERIPSATQLFTPDWIVRYMVENSLGRLWLEGHPSEDLRGSWRYYLDEAQQDEAVEQELAKLRAEYAQLNLEDIRVLDPCMGSGHILVYAFDVLMQIYREYGYKDRDAVRNILQCNLYGLDIDKRAAQLAYFALMMKARQYDSRFLTRHVEPRVYAVSESNRLEDKLEQLNYFGAGLDEFAKNSALNEMQGLLKDLHDAKEYGSILQVGDYNWDLLEAFVSEYDTSGQLDMFATVGIEDTQKRLQHLVQVGCVLGQKYHVVVTNPPYMPVTNGDAGFNAFIKKKYPDSKTDLFAVFIERCKEFTQANGFQAMITMHSWMFLSSYEKLREKLQNVDIVNMAHLGARAFEEIGGEVVQTTSFVMQNCKVDAYKGVYCRLVEPTTQQGKEDMFLAGENRYQAEQKNFSKIPGAPIAYWASENLREAFAQENYFKGITKKGVLTGNNEKFLRLWHEVFNIKVGWNLASHSEMLKSNKKWFPLTSGGEKRKWYGNLDTVVNLENDGYEIKNTVVNYRLRDPQYYMREAITWTEVTSGMFCNRYVPQGILFGNGGPVSFFDERLLYHLGLLNSKIVAEVMQFIAPTINYGPEQIKKIPLIVAKEDTVSEIVNDCISFSRTDWDSFETSWDFKRHPLLNGESSLASAYAKWEEECEARFNQLKRNEEELNRIFIKIYGLEEELTPDVEEKDVTVRKADKTREVKSLISYAVGCMFGRYSLDVEGLAYAGGTFDITKYQTFKADDDNIIPICDDEYFTDDIVGRFVNFIETAYGKATLEDNLRFIADALGGKGTPREIIRNYFVNDFYSDHCKIYQKRPIYWLFDSGKKNGFKCLIYMHRYQKDTLARIRTDYVFEQQSRYRTRIEELQQRVANAATTAEKVRLNKELTTFQAKAVEIHAYEEKIHHLADRMLSIDLDDGVKHNYEIFADVLAKVK